MQQQKWAKTKSTFKILRLLLWPALTCFMFASSSVYANEKASESPSHGASSASTSESAHGAVKNLDHKAESHSVDQSINQPEVKWSRTLPHFFSKKGIVEKSGQSIIFVQGQLYIRPTAQIQIFKTAFADIVTQSAHAVFTRNARGVLVKVYEGAVEVVSLNGKERFRVPQGTEVEIKTTSADGAFIATLPTPIDLKADNQLIYELTENQEQFKQLLMIAARNSLDSSRKSALLQSEYQRKVRSDLQSYRDRETAKNRAIASEKRKWRELFEEKTFQEVGNK